MESSATDGPAPWSRAKARLTGVASPISAPWRQLAERIRADVFAQGFDDKLGAFTQSYGAPHLDAANLLFHRLGFIPADDPRWISSVRATQQTLSRDGLLYRYRHQDDFGTPDSAFLVCSFWMVQALVSIGDQQAARQLFADILRSLVGFVTVEGFPRAAPAAFFQAHRFQSGSTFLLRVVPTGKGGQRGRSCFKHHFRQPPS